MKRLLLSLAVALLPAMAGAQSVQQGGSWTPGLPPVYSSSGSASPIVQQAGPAGGTGVGIKELSVIARGTGTPPFVGQGTGQFGTIVQIQDAPATNSGGYHALSLSANAAGGGLIAYGAYGGASALPLNLSINGTTYQFPFSISGIVGPSSSVIGHAACWNNKAGSLLADCGVLITSADVATAVASGTATFTNKTYDTAGAGNSFAINGLAVTSNTGTGAVARAASPTFTGTPSAPTASPGTNTTQLATTGFVQAALTATVVRVQTFTGNGTYTPNAHMISATIQCTGAGGGGGGMAGTTSASSGAGGGGSGSTSWAWVSAADVGVSKVVTIGAGGAGGTAGNHNGSNGTDTSVGTLCIGKGGGGGAANSLTGGVAGVAGTGDVKPAGNPGEHGLAASTATVSARAGNGGGSVLGGAGAGALTNSSGGNAAGGAAAANTGSGGGGGAVLDGNLNVAGGNGGSGFVVITEYCSE